MGITVRPSARVVCDSVSPLGKRLTTFQLDHLHPADLDELTGDAGLSVYVPADPTTVVLSATTDALNAYVAARHHNAQLATAVQDARLNHTPGIVDYEGLHLPYITNHERYRYDPSACAILAVARCTHPGQDRDVTDDMNLYSQMIMAYPPRLDAMEHMAIAAHLDQDDDGNFDGWLQLRHLFRHRGVDPT